MVLWYFGTFGTFGTFFLSFPSFPCHLLEVNVCQISCHLEEGGDSDSSLVSFHAVVVALCSGYSSGLKIVPLNRNRRMRNRMCGGVKGR